MKRTLRIEFESALHHGSGFGVAGLVDRAVLRDSRGMPYLAGSALKGRLRHGVLRVLVSTDQGGCEYGDRPRCEIGNPCLVCTLFGSARRQGKLMVSDAFPDEDLRRMLGALSDAGIGAGVPRDSTVRMGTALSRRTGLVRPHLLFSTETLPAGMRFEAKLRHDELNPAEEKALQDACLILTHFGASGARGLGQCSYVIPPDAAQ